MPSIFDQLAGAILEAAGQGGRLPDRPPDQIRAQVLEEAARIAAENAGRIVDAPSERWTGFCSLLLAAGRFARTLPAVDLQRGVGIGGRSWGGYLAPMAATQAPGEFSCVVAGIGYVDRIAAPLLVLHGEKDASVPFSQIESFVAHARQAGAAVELVTYPHEGHSNRKPQNQADTLDRIAGFFAQHLQPWDLRDNPSAGQVQI